MSEQPVGPVDGRVVPRYAGLTTFARLPRLVQTCLYASGAVFAGWYAFGLLVLFSHAP